MGNIFYKKQETGTHSNDRKLQESAGNRFAAPSTLTSASIYDTCDNDSQLLEPASYLDEEPSRTSSSAYDVYDNGRGLLEPASYIHEKPSKISSSTSRHHVQGNADHTQVLDSTLSSTTLPQTIADGKSVPTPTTQNKVVPSGKPEPTTQTRAIIFSLEEDIKTLENWMRCFIDDFRRINPSTIKIDKDWMPYVENSSIVIFYTSSTSEESISKMEHYMKYSVSRKGHARVIVVIGNIQVSEDKVRSEWKDSQYAQCELHMFTKTEWILQDPQLQEMVGKIKWIKDILPGDSQKIMNLNKENKSFHQSKSFRNGVIFFAQDSTQTESHWLEQMLRTDDRVDVIVTKTSKIKKLLTRVEGTYPICCILRLNKRIFWKIISTKNSQPPVIDYKLLDYFGKKKVAVTVVVDDLDDERSEEEFRALYNKSMFSQLAPLLLFRQEEMQSEYLVYLSSHSEAKMKAQSKWAKLQKSIEMRLKVPELPRTCNPQPILPSRKGSIHPEIPEEIIVTTDEVTIAPRNLGTVGIFSRSSNNDYSLLEMQLKSLSPLVSGVRPVYISNNQFEQFFGELKLCSFGILYHTKNRGRVNVTDVTDSLYDEELEIMSNMLERQNVIVVIDDLPASNLEEKNRILKNQPSIKKYACNLLLVSTQEKKDATHTRQKVWEALMSLG